MKYIVAKDERDYMGIEKATVKDIYDYFHFHKEIAVDTETEGFDPYTCDILTIQFGDKNNQYLVDCSTIDIQQFKSLLEDKSYTLLLQNAKFDLSFLYHNRIIPPKVYDTFLAESVLNKGDKFVRKSLDVLAERYCNVTLDKSIRSKIHSEGLSQRVVEYGLKDVAHLHEIKEKQIKKLKNLGLLQSMSLENAFVRVLAYIEYSGIYLDKELWLTKMTEDKASYDKYKLQLDKWIIDNKMDKYIESQLDLFNPETQCAINWASSTQVVPLFKDLGIDVKMKDSKTGKYRNSVDASIIKPQKSKSTIIPIYLEYKAAEKVISTYGESFIKQIHPITGRVHTRFKQIMNTGRLSSGGKDKKTREEYVNLQNIPADTRTRSCFTAKPGNILINADYSGQEQIVFANWTEDEDLLNFYRRKMGDMHSYIASKIYPELKDTPLNEIKEQHKDKRQIAKSAGFAINYGGTGQTIADNLGLTNEEGELIYKAYFDAFPGVKKYFKKVKEHALFNGYILFNDLTHSKSFIPFFDEYKKVEEQVNTPGFWAVYREEKAKDSELFQTELKPLVSKFFRKRGAIERAALNYPIQGSSAEITKLACVYLFKTLIEKELLFTVYFSNVVHDELMLEVPTILADEISEDTQVAMENAANRFCKIIKMKAEPVITKFWTH